MQYWSNSIFSSQCWTLNVDKTQCLVMILEMFPETGDVEMICPVKEANFLAEITKPESAILSIVLSILAHLLSTISMAPRALSHVRPNQSTRWQGSHIDFSSFVIKPASPRSVFTALVMLLHTWRSLSIVKKNSNAYALMSPMFFYRLKCFGANLRRGR